MNTTFSLERAKNGEPFTYDGRECKFGSIRDWVNPIGHLPIDTQEQWNKITSLIQEQ